MVINAELLLNSEAFSQDNNITKRETPGLENEYHSLLPQRKWKSVKTFCLCSRPTKKRGGPNKQTSKTCWTAYSQEVDPLAHVQLQCLCFYYPFLKFTWNKYFHKGLRDHPKRRILASSCNTNSCFQLWTRKARKFQQGIQIRCAYFNENSNANSNT